jgi:uncharacterized protein YegJ (DUF2314 family)
MVVVRSLTDDGENVVLPLEDPGWGYVSSSAGLGGFEVAGICGERSGETAEFGAAQVGNDDLPL